MTHRSLYVAGGILLLPAVMIAQLSTSVVSVTPGDAFVRKPVTLTVELQQGHRVAEIQVLYRPFGTATYRKAEMDLRGNTARCTISGEYVRAPFLEYYLVLATSSGARESFPPNAGGNPLTNPPPQPSRVTVQEEAQQQVLFLSPDPGSTVNPEDVLISISLLRADTAVVRKSTQVKIDDVNVTPGAVFSDDMIIYVPENTGLVLSPGQHTVKVGLFNRKGQLHAAAQMTFSVRSTGNELYAAEASVRAFDYALSVNVESRHEQILNEGTWYNRAGATFRGKTGIVAFNSNLFLTSDERSDRQPQHRYFFGVETPWVKAGYGDHYPALPELILSGKRVRGLQTSARYGILGVDVTLGQISRSIEGTISTTFPADSFVVEFQRDSTASFGRVDSSTWAKFGYGTYARNLFAVRPSIGNRETWEVGFSWLSSGDDLGSIKHGITPRENIVLGTDFMARFDQSRIELTGQAAVSAYNSDITSGTFSDAYIDSVYTSGAEGIKQARDYLKNYITVNDNFRPLGLKGLPMLAYELGLGLNYFDNAFSFTYLFRGVDYTSFGQSFLQTDIRGFRLVDRARIIDNQAFLTLGYERLQDNTAATKVATTVFSTFNVAATYLPRRDAPTITLGYSRYDNDNDLAVKGRDSLSAIEDVTNRVYLQSSYEFLFGARHTASLNVAVSDRADGSLREYDVRSTTMELGVTTLYRIPLRTVFSVAAFLNTLPDGTVRGATQQLNYTMISAAARYTIVRDVFVIAATVAPTFGDYRRVAFDLGSEWNARPDMQLILQFSFFSNQGHPNENIVSLRYRYSI
jgi:hypothetical protein